MKKQKKIAKSKLAKNKPVFLLGFCILTMLVVINLSQAIFIQKGQAEQIVPQAGVIAVEPNLVPTPPTLVSNRCSAYTAPPVPTPLPGGTFYVDAQNGNDTNSGTSAAPWRTLAKANAEAEAGTLFYLRGIFTNQWINPNASGTSDDKITYRKEPGQNAVLETTPGAEIYGIFIGAGRSHIVVDGLEIRNSPNAFQVKDGANNVWLRNLYIHNTGSSTFRYGAHTNRLEDSVLVDIGNPLANDTDSLDILGDADNNIVVRNYFGNSEHGAYDIIPDLSGNSDNNIFAQNIVDNQWSSGVIVNGRAVGTIVECNIIRNATQNTQVNYPRMGLQLTGDNNIIRYNYIYNNKSDGILLTGYIFATVHQQYPENNHIYHNTIVGNGRSGLYMHASDSGYPNANAYVRNNIIENNLLWGNGGGNFPDDLNYDVIANFYSANNPWAPGFTDGNIFRYNNASNRPFFAVYRHPSMGGNYVYNTPELAQAANPSWTNNRRQDPLFTNPSANDYSLQSNSPMINQGRIIPGVSIPGVTYFGSAPDLGAFESGATGGCTGGGQGQGQVTWQNVQGTSSTGGTVQHTGATYFGMAKTQQTISAPGYFEWTYNGYSDVWVGLGNNNDEQPGTGDNDLSYSYSGSIREFGVYKAEGNPVSGDRLRIEITSAGTVIFKKNSQTIYTSLTPASGAYYLVFKSQETVGAKISDAASSSSSSSSNCSTLFDYDNDGKADISVFRPSDKNWYLNRSSAGFAAVNFGLSTDVITPADFDGDGKTDVAVFRPSNGTWYILNSSNGANPVIQFGSNGDIPVQADYDNDNKADVAVWRPSNGVWYILRSSDGGMTIVGYGLSTDKPAVGDYNGDGSNDLAVYRPSNGTWYINNYGQFQFGISTDKIAPADYDGDGKTDAAVYRPSDGTWYILNSSNGSNLGIQFGISSDIPAPADYDGDGKADIVVYRPSEGKWHMLLTGTGYSYSVYHFGLNGDIPTPSVYVR